MNPKAFALVALTLAAFAACTGGEGTPDAGDEGIKPTFSSVHEKLLQPRCSFESCHGGETPVRELALDERLAFTDLVDADASVEGWKYVVPGDPEQSLLYRVLVEDMVAPGVGQMPTGGGVVPQEEIDALRQWIEDGAADD